MYLKLLERYKKEYEFKLFAYVLMPHHLHLLIEPNENFGISEIMRSLNTAYSKYFNNAYNRQGHLFRERFKATLVEKEEYLKRLVDYIHLNPLRLELVTDPQDWQYSSLYLYKGKGEKIGLGLIDGYRENVEAGTSSKPLSGEEMLSLHKKLQRGGVIGSKEFMNRVKKEIESRKKEKEKSFPKPVYPLWLGASAFLLLVIGLVWFYLHKTEVINKNEDKSLGEGKSRNIFAITQIEDLNNTEWNVRFFRSDSKEEAFVDKLSFLEGKFISARFSQEGFSPTNYSITQEKDKIIWETIQSKDNTNLSWRGEIEKNEMQGVVSLRTKDKAQDFLFKSISFRRRR